MHHRRFLYSSAYRSTCCPTHCFLCQRYQASQTKQPDVSSLLLATPFGQPRHLNAPCFFITSGMELMKHTIVRILPPFSRMSSDRHLKHAQARSLHNAALFFDIRPGKTTPRTDGRYWTNCDPSMALESDATTSSNPLYLWQQRTEVRHGNGATKRCLHPPCTNWVSVTARATSPTANSSAILGWGSSCKPSTTEACQHTGEQPPYTPPASNQPWLT